MKSVLAAAFLVLIVAGSILVGQSTPPARGTVIGAGLFTSFVENMDRSLAFYHDAFGMDVPALPASGQRPYNQPNPQLFAMFQINGAKERHQSARIPDTRLSLEFMEIQNVDHKTATLRMQDPGVVTLVLVVRDIDAALAKARQANAPMLTPGNAPVKLEDGRRAVLLRDVDGRPVELVQAAATPAGTTAAAGNISEIGLTITVNDLDKTLQVYRDVLGFSVASAAANAEPSMRTLTGLGNATIRHARVLPPGSTPAIEFLEFKGVERTPLKLNIQDRGAARLQLRSQNIDALVDAMKAAGMTVVSEGGKAVPIPPNYKGALVADPNNFFFTPIEPCDNCAPTIAPVRQ